VVTVDDEYEDIDHWTVEKMAAFFTPREAAKIKYQVAFFHSLDPEGARHSEELSKNSPGHRMFVYCLDAVARRA
jgi:hypothetical protein